MPLIIPVCKFENSKGINWKTLKTLFLHNLAKSRLKIKQQHLVN